MFTTKNYKKNLISLLNFFISLMPLSLIVGNLFTNINIIIVSLLGLFLYGRKIFSLEKKTYQYLIYLFFFYLIITTFFNNWQFFNEYNSYSENFLKSIFYLRFLVFFLVVYTMIETKEFNTKLFFLSCAFFSLVISFDIVFQVIFKKNIIGYTISLNRPSSFFGNENIAGGYIQRFILFFIFYISLKKKFTLSYLTILFIIFSTVIIVTGNKMPAAIFIFTFFSYLLIKKKIKYLLVSFFTVFIVVFALMKDNPTKRMHIDYAIFVHDAIEIFKNSPKLFYYNRDNEIKEWNSGYLTHFNSGVQMWKKNKLFGSGLKSFRLKCSYDSNQTCNTHPHNYVIEIVVDTGLFGLTIIYTIVVLGSINFIKYYLKEIDYDKKFITIIFFILVLAEFFPIRSSGSFFTTSNSSYIFLILPIFLNIKKLNKL